MNMIVYNCIYKASISVYLSGGQVQLYGMELPCGLAVLVCICLHLDVMMQEYICVGALQCINAPCLRSGYS